MRWWVTSTGILFALSAGCSSSVCTDEFVGVEDQSDLDALASCTRVKGNVEIRSKTLTSLDGLDGLSVVEGRLWITANTALTDLSGLSGLTFVGGESLSIESNPRLTSAALPALSTVVGELSLSENESLVSMSLPALASLGGGLLISEDATLPALTGLEALTELGGNLRIVGNDSLTDLSGLGALTEVSADVLISENAALLTLSLPGLTSVGAGGPSPTSIGPSTRQLFVAMNPALMRLDLPALRFVGAGGIRVYNNAALAQCQADALAMQIEKSCQCSGNTGSGTCR